MSTATLPSRLLTPAASTQPAATQQSWKQFFTHWPEGIPRRGVLVDTQSETTLFKSFMLQGDMLLLERTNPDPLGARFILLQFDAVHALKFTDPLKETVLADAGFIGRLSQT